VEQGKGVSTMTEKLEDVSAAGRKRSLRHRRWTRRFTLGALIAGLAAGAWAFEAGMSAGLKGILSEEVPADLAAEAFEALGPTWSQWSQDTAAEIQKFYKLEGDAASQREQLAGLKKRLDVMDKALGDARYASIHTGLMTVRGPLARRVAVAEAILDTLEADPQSARKERIAAKAEAVSAALSSLETDLKTVPGGTAWLPFVKAQELRAALKESASSESTVAALNESKSKLARRESLTDEAQKKFLGRPAFVALESAIDEQLAAIAAPLPTDNTAALREELTKLAAALESYEATGSKEAAHEARATWKKVKELAPDRGAHLEVALGAHYFNYNVRIVASEAFLSKVLADSRTEMSPVSDVILGAAVSGQQTTTAHVSADAKPAADRVRFDLVLNGHVQSNTVGYTSQATVSTFGNHTFVARKEIVFDGKDFQVGPGSIAVNANNTTTGINTRYSGGLFGGYAQRVASQEVANRRPASEAIARQRISDRVLPQFNREVDKAFADSEQRLENELFAGLRATNLYPDAQHYQSTDKSIRLSTRLMADDELGGAAAEPNLLPEGSGASIALHESVVNNAIDRIGLAGKTMTEEELRHHVEAFLSKALSREFKFKAPEETPAKAAEEEGEEDKTPSKLAFTDQDPIRVRFRNGQLLLTIRAGLKREGKDPIPAQEITAPIRFSVEGDQIHATRDSLEIVGIEGNIGRVEQKVMNTKIGNALPDRMVSAKVELTAPNRKVEAKVARIQIVDGWIAVGLQ